MDPNALAEIYADPRDDFEHLFEDDEPVTLYTHVEYRTKTVQIGRITKKVTQRVIVSHPVNQHTLKEITR